MERTRFSPQRANRIQADMPATSSSSEIHLQLVRIGPDKRRLSQTAKSAQTTGNIVSVVVEVGRYTNSSHLTPNQNALRRELFRQLLGPLVHEASVPDRRGCSSGEITTRPNSLRPALVRAASSRAWASMRSMPRSRIRSRARSRNMITIIAGLPGSRRSGIGLTATSSLQS